MKYNSSKAKSLLILAAGLLLVSGSFIAARYVQLPHFLRGSMIGVGLALEMLALGLIQKRKREYRGACAADQGR